MKSIFWSLKHSGFRILWTGMVISGISQWAMMIALAWLVFDLSGSALAVALITFSGFVGTFVMVPFGGILADRADRKNLLLLSMYSPMVTSALLAVLTLSGAAHVWEVVLLAITAGFGRSLGQPAARALTPNLVPEEDVLNAVSLRNVALRGPRLFGPLVAAPLLATVGAGGVFVCTGMLYALAAVSLVRLPRPPSPRALNVTTTIAAEFKEGFRYITGTSPINLVIALVASHCALTMSFDSLLPSLAKDVLGGDSALYSYLVMAVGAGALFATLAVATLRQSHTRGAALLVTALLSGGSLLVIAIASGPVAALIGLALAGGSQAAFMAMSEALLLERVPDRLRGRAMGVYTMNNAGLMALFALINGYVADVWHIQGLFLVLGLAFVTVTLVAYALSGRIRFVFTSGTLESMPQPVPSVP